MDGDSLRLIAVMRSCAHMLFAMAPVIAAAIVATRLAREKIPAAPVWMLCGLYVVSLVMDALQLFLPLVLARTGSYETVTLVSGVTSCAIDLPLIVLAGVAFFLMKAPASDASRVTGGA